MKELDRRIKRTRRLLGDALVSLILEKGYDAITVKEITERADVAHATFYRHYRDKDELLIRQIEGVIVELEDLTQEPALHNADGYLIFKHVEEHSVLYRILFSSQGTTHVRKRVRERIAANKLATCASLQQADEGFFSPALVANHMAASLLSLIEWWLEHNMPHSPYHMAQIYHRLVSESTLQTALGEAAEHQ
jgi:AcrR family transcriptional regulator